MEKFAYRFNQTTMKVQELIDKLKDCPENASVFVSVNEEEVFHISDINLITERYNDDAVLIDLGELAEPEDYYDQIFHG